MPRGIGLPAHELLAAGGPGLVHVAWDEERRRRGERLMTRLRPERRRIIPTPPRAARL